MCKKNNYSKSLQAIQKAVQELENLSESELLEIVNLSITTDKVKNILEVITEKEGILEITEHAFAKFCDLHIRKSVGLKDSELQFFLENADKPGALGAIGNAARLSKINKAQIEMAINKVQQDDWAYYQLAARLVLINLQQNKKSDMKDDQYKIEKKEALNKFIKFKSTTWAIIEIIQFLERDELIELRDIMASKSILNKSNRAYVKEEINRKLKNIE